MTPEDVAGRAARKSRPRLDEAELAAWDGLLRVHNQLVRQLDAELQSEHGLPLAAYDVLAQLVNQPRGERQMSQLAEQVLLSPSGCTRLVDRLEAEGLVERRRSDADSRVVIARLTPAGRRRLTRAVSSHIGSVRSRFVERLTRAEVESLAAIWSRLLDDQR